MKKYKYLIAIKKIFIKIKNFLLQYKLYKKKILKFINIFWVEVKEWIKALWPDIFFYLFILTIPVYIGIIFVPKIWELINNVGLDNLYSIWNHLNMEEASINYSLNNNINYKIATRVVSKTSIDPEKSTTSKEELQFIGVLGLTLGILWLFLHFKT